MQDAYKNNDKDVLFDIFQWMDEESKSIYDKIVHLRKYRPGQFIISQEETNNVFYRIRSGWVRSFFMGSDGKEVILLIYEPGDCFGGAGLIDDEPQSQTMAAITDVEVEILDRSSYKRLREQCGAFDNALLKLLAREIHFISKRYCLASLSPLPARVANRLISAAFLFDSKESDGNLPSFPLSQSELASMVGASRQSVNKVLQSFQSEGLLRIEYGNLLIVDLQGLSVRATQTE